MQKINYFPKRKELEKVIKNLSKKDITLIVTDFDDTIFSRYEQLNWTDELSLLLQKNRWNKWNEVIKNIIWIDSFMKKFYENKTFPKDIISTMNPKYDLILTAWYIEIQKAKMKATKLENFPIEIVLHWEEKPQKVLEYIIKIWFIPKKIKIYEDRTQHFEASKKDFEEITNSQLEIIFIKMNWNNWELEQKKVA